MKQVELKNYVKKQLKEYLGDFHNNMRVSLSNLKKHSVNDGRLAELAQAYYLLNDNYEQSVLFEEYTKEFFKSKEDYLKSESKYVWQYKSLVNSKDDLKNSFRTKIVKLMMMKKITAYRVAKETKVNQSNLSLFLNKGELNKLSVDKVYELHNWLNEA